MFNSFKNSIILFSPSMETIRIIVQRMTEEIDKTEKDRFKRCSLM